MDNCTIDCIQKIGQLDYTATCNFVQSECQQNFIQFIQAYYCGLHSSFLLLIVFGAILFAFLYLALNALTQHSLAPAVQNFIDRFQISHTLAGVTFLAFANGAPDVLTAILAGSSSSGSTVLIPFGSIFGASLFSTAFILSAVIFLSPGNRLSVKKNQILLPLGFYIFGIVFLITISITYQKMNMYLASVLIIAYAFFIVFILKNQTKRVKQHQASQNQLSQSDPQIESKKKINSQVEQQEYVQKNQFYIFLQKVQLFFEFLYGWLIPPRSKSDWNFMKTTFSLLLSPFVMALSQDIEAAFNSRLFQIPLIVFMSVPAMILLINILLCQYKGLKQVHSVFFTIYSFLITVCWVTIVCAALINLLELMQILTNINSVFLGLTLLAWANCIGDYLSITMFAKRGKAATAVSGIFSGQLFNFLIGFGCSLFAQSANGQYKFDIFNFNGGAFEIISDSIVVLVICAGLLYLLLVFYTVIKTNGVLQKRQGVFFRSYYIGFLLLALIIAISTDFFRQFECII